MWMSVPVKFPKPNFHKVAFAGNATAEHGFWYKYISTWIKLCIAERWSAIAGSWQIAHIKHNAPSRVQLLQSCSMISINWWAIESTFGGVNSWQIYEAAIKTLASSRPPPKSSGQWIYWMKSCASSEVISNSWICFSVIKEWRRARSSLASKRFWVFGDCSMTGTISKDGWNNKWKFLNWAKQNKAVNLPLTKTCASCNGIEVTNTL